jgi:hypothetical protein
MVGGKQYSAVGHDRLDPVSEVGAVTGPEVLVPASRPDPTLVRDAAQRDDDLDPS